MVILSFFVLLWNNRSRKILSTVQRTLSPEPSESKLPTWPPFTSEYFGMPENKSILWYTQNATSKSGIFMSLHYLQPFPGPHSICPVVSVIPFITEGSSSESHTASGCHLSSGSFGLNSPKLFPWVSWPCYTMMCPSPYKTAPNLSVSGLPHGWIQVSHLWHKKWYSSYVLSACQQAVRDFTLSTWLRWWLPGFPTAKLLFPPLSS